MKSSHMLLCAVLLVVGVVLLTTGVGALAFLPFVACTQRNDSPADARIAPPT